MYSRGAQKVLCAFRGTESFSTVTGQFKSLEKYLLGYKIRNLALCALRTCKVARVYAKIDKSYLGF